MSYIDALIHKITRIQDSLYESFSIFELITNTIKVQSIFFNALVNNHIPVRVINYT